MTVSTSTRGASGCTCQKPSAATEKVWACPPAVTLVLDRRAVTPASRRACSGRAPSAAIRQSSTATSSWERCARMAGRPSGSAA